MPNIRRLPRSACGPLRSGVVLFDLPRVVEELVNNSLDAGATKVLVFVNIGANFVKVEDNGHGITRDELVIMGEKYATSKTGAMDDSSASTLGFRGEALSSLSDISVVEIRSKGRGKPNAYCKIIKGSRCLFIGIDDQMDNAGTTVIVRDLFYNQPVRRRYMQSSPKKVLLSLKKCILRIALVHSRVSFRVTDIENEDELLCTTASSSPLQLVSDAFGTEVSCSLHKIIFSDQTLTLSGYMSEPSDAFSRKAFQYLYINSRFVSKSPIHNFLNNMASNIRSSLVQQRIPEIQSGKRHKIQAYPAFMLNLSCSLSLYDLSFEPSKTIIEFKDWGAILTFFEKAARHFWLQYSPQLLEGISFSHITGASGKSGSEKEDVSKSVQINEKRGKFQLENSLNNSFITMNVLEYIGSSESHEKSKNIVREVESTPSRTDDFGESCSFLHPSSDMGYVLGSESNDMGLLDSNIDQGDAASFIVDDGLTSDLMPQIRQKYMPSSRWKSGVPEIVRNQSFQYISSDYNSGINDDKRSLNVLGALIEPDLDCCNVMEHESCNLASCSMYNDDCYEVCHSRKEHFTWDIRGVKVADTNLGLRNRLHEEVVNSSRPSHGVLRKCHTEGNLKSSLADSYKPNFFNNLFAMDDKGSQLGLEEGRIRTHSPEAEWYHPSPFTWNVGAVEEIHNLAKTSTSGRNLRSFKGDGSWIQTMMEDGDEHVSSWSRCCSVNSNSIFESTKLDQDHFSSLRIQMHDTFPSEKLTFAKDKTCWLCSDDQNTIKNENDSQCRWQFIPNYVEADEVSCTRESLGHSMCQVRRKRSQSAPPFYKKKDKFSVLCDYLTTKTEEKPDFLLRMTDKSCLANDIPQLQASQPFPEVIPTEASRPCFRYPANDNPNILNVRSSHQVSNINDVSKHSTADLVKWRGKILENIDGELSHKSAEQMSDVLDISSGLLLLSGGLVPESVDKDDLQDARVLLQLDKKFIPVVAGGTLLVIDQHAADERIRLEELRQKVVAGESITVTYLDSPQELILPEMGFQLLQKYKEKIQKWGWVFNTRSQFSGSFGKNMNILKRRESGVSLIAVPCILGISLTEKDLLEFIDQLIQTDGSSSIPPSVVRILNFKACRGAIMFGDSLLPSECSLIVEELKKTSLCFQCAHGRPTTVPLLNIASLHEQLSRLNVRKGGPKRAWHGLQRHVPDITRAQMLLDSAKRFPKG